MPHASASNGCEYRLTFGFGLGSGGFGGGSYTVHYMPVGTRAEKMRDYEIGEARTLEAAKAIADSTAQRPARQKPPRPPSQQRRS